MGQSESSTQKPPTTPLRHRESRQHNNVRKAVQSHAAPTTATLLPSILASTSTSNTTATGAVAARNPSSHSRARSITTSSTPAAYAQSETAYSHKSDTTSTMGNAESRQRPPSRSVTLPPPSSEVEKEVRQPSPAAQPVDVPHSHDGLDEKETFEPFGTASELEYGLPPLGRYDRPPRLPLPIEEELHTPGSPILAPQDLKSPVDSNDADEGVPRRTSMLSSTTMDDDDADEDVFAPDESVAPVVPTNIRWGRDADKVYVTGTFVNWDRKFRLHRDKDHSGFSVVVPLKPGTHHIKFLVDGDMITSDDLPTTVDYTNILVNYIEVVAPLPVSAQEQPPATAEPMPIPGAGALAGQTTGTGESTGRKLDVHTDARAPETAADLSSPFHETIAPNMGRSSADPPHSTSQTESAPTTASHHGAKPQQAQPPKQKLPRPKYTNQIPQFFLDQDINDPNDERYRRASRIIQQLPQPPTLPMFLGKSILNATTPHKDDASVLTLPNHTVLNHLATSSIKNGVLATSGTTRYQKKFLTTIMHKPTSDDG